MIDCTKKLHSLKDEITIVRRAFNRANMSALMANNAIRFTKHNTPEYYSAIARSNITKNIRTVIYLIMITVINNACMTVDIIAKNTGDTEAYAALACFRGVLSDAEEEYRLFSHFS